MRCSTQIPCTGSACAGYLRARYIFQVATGNTGAVTGFLQARRMPGWCYRYTNKWSRGDAAQKTRGIILAMDEALRRAGWICIAVAAGAYFTYLGIDVFFNKKASKIATPIIVRDNLRPDEHHLSGILLVPMTCDQLKVASRQISKYEYELIFESWPEPSIPCKEEPSARAFKTIVFAPAVGVHFSAILDKKPLPIAVYPIIEEN